MLFAECRCDVRWTDDSWYFGPRTRDGVLDRLIGADVKVRYQVAIASTAKGLDSLRARLVKSVVSMGNMPIDLVATDILYASNSDTLRRHLSRTDYLVVAVSSEVDADTPTLDGLRKVVDVAVDRRVPTLALVFGCTADPDGQSAMESPGVAAVLADIRDRAAGLVQRVDVPAQATQMLNELVDTYRRPGWVSSSELPAPDVAAELARLGKENADLKQRLGSFDESEAAREIRWGALVNTMEENKILIPVWNKVATMWEQPVEMTLYTFFIRMGPQLAVEVSMSDAVEFIPTAVCELESRDSRAPWVVPLHSLNLWLTDLMALKLVRPSRRKRSAKDKNQYWRLTREGRAFLSYVRRSALDAGGHRHVGFTQEFPIVTDFRSDDDD